MKISELYLKEFIDLYEKTFDEKIALNEEDGLYHFEKMGMVVKSWNRQIGTYSNLSKEQINSLIKFMIKVETYWFENEKNI